MEVWIGILGPLACATLFIIAYRCWLFPKKNSDGEGNTNYDLLFIAMSMFVMFPISIIGFLCRGAYFGFRIGIRMFDDLQKLMLKK